VGPSPMEFEAFKLSSLVPAVLLSNCSAGSISAKCACKCVHLQVQQHCRHCARVACAEVCSARSGGLQTFNRSRCS
jgi:hypothetical protein